MNWSNVKLILGREIRDQLRDRRTLFMIAVLPILLYPLLGMSFYQIAQFMREQPTSVLIVGAEELEGLPKLFDDGRFTVRLFERPAQRQLLTLTFAANDSSQPEAARRAVQKREYDAAVYFPRGFADRLLAFRQEIKERQPDRDTATGRSLEWEPQVPSPEILYSTATEKSQLAFARVASVLRAWTDEVGKVNLTAGGVPTKAARPFDVESADVAQEVGRRGAAMWAKLLPVLLLLWAMTGAFYPAVDLCAGEKERGTLETLLSSPAERTEIVLGKLMTIMLFSMITAALNLLSMGLTGMLLVFRIPAMGGPPPLTAVLWLAIALVPVAALFSALCLALAAFARSTKEGQYYLMPLLLVTMPLVVLPMASSVELNLGNSLIPVTGVVLVLRSLLEGNYWQARQFLPPVIFVTLACCLFSIRWAVEQFNSESVLFRESERIDFVLWMRHVLQDRGPTPTVAGAVFCGLVILLVKFFLSSALPPIQGFRGTAVVVVVSQLVIILTPALLMTIMLTSSPRQTLLLRRPPPLAIIGTAALAVAIHPLVAVLNTAVLKLYPVNAEVEKALSGLLEGAPGFWQVAVLFALMPAICEELAFRGFILSGFRHLGYKWRAIFYSALFFGLSHAVLQQWMITGAVGLVLGLIAVQTGSIWPGMLFHMLHNTLGLAVGRVTPELVERWPALAMLLDPHDASGMKFHWPIVAASGVVSFMILWWFLRLPYSRSHEEQQHEALAHAA